MGKQHICRMFSIKVTMECLLFLQWKQLTSILNMTQILQMTGKLSLMRSWHFIMATGDKLLTIARQAATFCQQTLLLTISELQAKVTAILCFPLRGLEKMAKLSLFKELFWCIPIMQLKVFLFLQQMTQISLYMRAIPWEIPTR